MKKYSSYSDAFRASEHALLASWLRYIEFRKSLWDGIIADERLLIGGSSDNSDDNDISSGGGGHYSSNINTVVMVVVVIKNQ